MQRDKEKRLEAFETMHQAVRTEYESIMKKMEMLKADGRNNSATYKELMGRKLMYGNILELYNIYDL